MEQQLTELYKEREAALQAWDATAYNKADQRIREVAAYMRAEVKLGLRADPIFSCEVA